MTRNLAPILIAAGALLWPAVAPAKEISKVAVCGIHNACTTYEKGDVADLHAFAGVAGSEAAPPKAAPFYRVRITIDERAHGGEKFAWSMVYVPSARRVRTRDDASGRYAWYGVSDAGRALDEAIKGLPAFAAARLKGLDSKPLEAQVDETFAPAAGAGSSTPPSAPADDGAPWGWILLALGAGSLAAGGIVRTLRRRATRAGEASPAAAQ